MTEPIDELVAIEQCLEDVGVCVATVLQDGKITIADVKPALELVGKAGDFVTAVKNSSQFMPQAKDIDDVEAIALGKRMFDVFKKISAAAHGA